MRRIGLFASETPAVNRLRAAPVSRPGRVWAGLDLLLTGETITEARDKNDMRLKAPASCRCEGVEADVVPEGAPGGPSA
jgi:hypothetical protein